MEENEYDYHYKHFGDEFGVKFEDKAYPLKGGKVYVNFPVLKIINHIEWKLPLFKNLLVPLERLRNVVRMKALINFTAEHWKRGSFDINVEYTLIHTDSTEESGVIKGAGKASSSVSLEVRSNNEQFLPKFILRPFMLEATFKRNSEIKIIWKCSESSLNLTLS